MSIRHETLELNNILLSKYRDEDTMGRERFIIFAINQAENKLIGANIIDLAEARLRKNMTISLRKYKSEDIMKSPEKIEDIINETHEDFDENITFTLWYFLEKGFQFADEWDKVSFAVGPSKKMKYKPKQECCEVIVAHVNK